MRRLVEAIRTQKTIVTAACLAATILACALATPVRPAQVIRYPNRLKPRLERCTSGTVPVLGPLDTIDEGRCFQYGDIYVSRTNSGLPCSLEELEVVLAKAACTEDATFVRILHTQTSMTSGTDCHTIRAAFFECIEMPSDQETTVRDD